ncbi:hypothetical protein HanXRQr2_Chr06g0244461 [Helianthus annuus]|uniref:Uncharacterized protein n=1 Tax=Helianthus annuus TaxID=4232 RepID=A0A9K3IQU7_HELAN|nr:hypothetical protein HanXRQr2_Chr06g0244461 [Helianthus annuus]
MPFSARLASFVTFVQRFVFPHLDSGSKRFLILPISSGSLTPSIFLCYVRGISVFFVNLKGNSVFFTFLYKNIYIYIYI